MHEANWMPLSDAEFEELERLADSSDAKSYAIERMGNPGMLTIYRSLHEKGMVDGFDAWGSFSFEGVSVEGASLIRNHRKTVEEEKRLRKQRMLHDYKVAIIGSSFGTVLGILLEHFIGIMNAIQSALSFL